MMYLDVTHREVLDFNENHHFVYPSGKSRHGGITYYSFTLGCLGAIPQGGTFATLR